MNDANDLLPTTMVRVTFPITYHGLHPDASMNFQINRRFGWVGNSSLAVSNHRQLAGWVAARKRVILPDTQDEDD